MPRAKSQENCAPRREREDPIRADEPVGAQGEQRYLYDDDEEPSGQDIERRAPHRVLLASVSIAQDQDNNRGDRWNGRAQPSGNIERYSVDDETSEADEEGDRLNSQHRKLEVRRIWLATTNGMTFSASNA